MAGTDRAAETANVQGCLARAVAGVLGLPGADEVDIETSFADLGLDSVGGIEVAKRVAGELGMRVPPVLLFDFPTIRELSQHLVSIRRHGAVGAATE
ncbi:acyl carrier protein [Plantactinospora siamensis]|uniref:Acyl carrier protein n=1 Tax=Plantactinospora siamensis TaxID=555372 RepID=A0ABV6NWQ2_9ACTN